MPTITLNKKDVLSLIGKKVTDEVLKEKIPMLGTDLDDVSGDEIKVEVFPNRPDMLSEEGFARALSSFLGIKTGLREYKAENSNYKYKIIKNNVRPCVGCAVIKDIKLTDEAVASLMNLQEKLHVTHGRNRRRVSIGVYDLDMIKFPLTYTTEKPSFKFIPLGEDREMSLGEILELHPKGVDYAYILDKYDEYPIWFDADKKVLSMPPIINSDHTKVTGKTKNLFIDATGTSKEAVEQALNIICVACADRDGKIYKVVSEKDKHPKLNPGKIKFNIAYVEKLLGIKLSKAEISKLLRKMGLEYKQEDSLVLYPSYRADIMAPVDVVEDLAIAYGYDNIEDEIPNVSTIADEDKFEKFKNIIAESCIGLGLTEVTNYNITNKDDVTKLMNVEIGTVNIINSLSKEYNCLRPWIIPSLLNVIKNNKHNEYPQNIFEMGKVFVKKDMKEPTRLAIVLAHVNANYTEAKRILDAILESLGLEGSYSEVKHGSFIEGRVARVSIKGKKIAYIGEINPGVLNNFNLDTPVAAIELNLSEIYDSSNV